MIQKLRRHRFTVALPTALVMAALALTVPLLDAEPHGAVPSFQADGAGAGYLDHDHSVCIQHGASPWSPVHQTGVLAPVPVRDTDPPPPARRCHDPSHSGPFQPRAPPIA